jgi:DNA-binding transcriptional MerR regulator
MINAKRTVTSQEVAVKFRLSYPTVTHYTNLGFFRVIGRRGNKRLYDEAQVRGSLRQLQRLATEGYPLRLIRDKFIRLRPP